MLFQRRVKPRPRLRSFSAFRDSISTTFCASVSQSRRRLRFASASCLAMAPGCGYVCRGLTIRGTRNAKRMSAAFLRSTPKPHSALARPTRFERVTFAFGGQRSIQLSYGRVAHRLADWTGHGNIPPHRIVRRHAVCKLGDRKGSPQETCMRPLEFGWYLPTHGDTTADCLLDAQI